MQDTINPVLYDTLFWIIDIQEISNLNQIMHNQKEKLQ